MSTPIRRLLAAAAATVLVTGCFGTQPSPSPTPSTAASPPSAQPSGPASPGASASEAPTAEPVPSEDLGAFSCELPIVDDATTPRANIVDVRVGAHDGYDRVVFEFDGGLPEITLDRATPPFSQDASGLPLDVEGDAFLRLTMRGGTKQTEDGTSSYDGPTDFDPEFATLVDLIEGGDFEAQSTWYLGLTDDACVRVIPLTDDGRARLVIDVER